MGCDLLSVKVEAYDFHHFHSHLVRLRALWMEVETLWKRYKVVSQNNQKWSRSFSFNLLPIYTQLLTATALGS